jgi:hypothetical protein
MVEAACQELLCHRISNSCLALCKGVLSVEARSRRNLNELQGSKFGGKQVFSCSPDFSMVVPARQELFRRRNNNSGFALCKAVLFVKLRSSRNLNELQGSKFGGKQVFSCSPDFSMVVPARQELSAVETTIQALRFARLFCLLNCGQVAI